jgi:transportin-1
LDLRYRIGRCWLVVIRSNRSILTSKTEQLFNFFYENLTTECYELNFTAAEFFLYLIDDDEEDFVKIHHIFSLLEGNLKLLLPYILYYMNLAPNDINGMDNKSKTESHHDEDQDESTQCDTSVIEGYNPNWTLRQCCAKFLDKISALFPEPVLDVIKPYLQDNMQNSEWNVKERSILALGAIANGCNSLLKQHLSALIPFLIRELQNPHKLVRAISLWTLSRFTKFIMIDNLSENANELFKDYLSETLKRFLDLEVIVQDAACTAFASMIQTEKGSLEPYLYDIFKIIVNVFELYQGTSLLTLYDIISVLTENYAEHFKNTELIGSLVNCIVKKWYKILNSEDREQYITPIVDMFCSILKVSQIKSEYINDFLKDSLRLIEMSLNNFNDSKEMDKEVVIKCFDLVSTLCQTNAESIKNHDNKNKIIELIYRILDTGDNYLKHHIIILISEIANIDAELIKPRLDATMNYLIHNLELPLNKFNTLEVEKISVCNNSTWTLGLIAISLQQDITRYIPSIMEGLVKLLSFTKLNRSLAQNISICIGRLSLIDPTTISEYLDNFIKQFCLSLRSVKNTKEKQDAYRGLSSAIMQNPGGIVKHFAFFCDAICQYDDSPIDIENIFQNLIYSYKSTLGENWFQCIENFPEKLQRKMNLRFKVVY